MAETTKTSRGFAVWLTGLPCSGKSTIAQTVVRLLDERGLAVEHLDGDVVRTHLSKGLGYSREDRDTNIARIGWVTSRFVRHGVPVVVAAVSPYRETRARVRALVEQHGTFVEVWVNASVDECIRRDVKGMYAKALAGELPQFTGVDDPYEAPEAAEVVVDTESLTPDESAALVLDALERHGVLP
jgi:adenylyl-sulfate kinase